MYCIDASVIVNSFFPADAIYVATAKYFNVPLITLDSHQKEKANLCINAFSPIEVNKQL